MYSINPGMKKWTWHKVALPVSKFRIIFAFTMGYPFECAAALDDVETDSCSEIIGEIKSQAITGGVKPGIDPHPDLKFRSI